MKQTAVEQLGIAFIQWQKDWDNFEKTGKNKPKSFDDFIKPFLEMEKQQIIDAVDETNSKWKSQKAEIILTGEQYYNETFNK